MGKMKVFIIILLATILIGCGTTNRQNQSPKESETIPSSKVVQATPSSTTSSESVQNEDSEEEFRTNRKLKNKKVTIGSFKYTYSVLDDGTVWIKKISFVKGKSIKILKVPSKIDGRDVTVMGHSYGTGIYDILSEDEDYDGCEVNIFGVMLEESFGARQPKNIYNKTKNIEWIHLPSTLKVLGIDTFDYLPQYQILDIGDCVAKNIDYIFVNKEWSTLKVSKTNSKYKAIKNMVLTKDGKELLKAFGQCDKLKVPNGVEKIKESAFLSIKANHLFIPFSVKEIDAGKYNVHKNIMQNYIKNVSVSKDNKVYGKLKNSIYKKSNMELILLCNEEQTIIIPEGIKIVKDFWRNGYSDEDYESMYIKRVEIPKSVTKYEYRVRCSRKTIIVFKGKKCPKLDYPLFLESSSLKIYVPHGCKKKYKRKLKDSISDKDMIIEQGQSP